MKEVSIIIKQNAKVAGGLVVETQRLKYLQC